MLQWNELVEKIVKGSPGLLKEFVFETNMAALCSNWEESCSPSLCQL